MYEKEYVIANKTYLLKPLTVREGARFVFDIGSDDKRSDAIIGLIEATLKKSGYSEEFDLGCIGELANAVMNVNGLDNGSARSN